VDRDGKKIKFFQWVVNEKMNGGGYWRVSMDTKALAPLEAFAKTEEGFKFLSQYAAKGQEIGSVKFLENGEYADVNLNFQAYDIPSTDYGYTRYQASDNESNFDIGYQFDRANKAGISLTIGHEAFLHLDLHDKQFIKAFKQNGITGFNNVQNEDVKINYRGKKDHRDYMNGKGGASRFNKFSQQLYQIFGSKTVKQAKQEHDEKYKNNK
jgi:hypothetical protein